SELSFFFSSRRRHTRSLRDWSSDVCSSDLYATTVINAEGVQGTPGSILPIDAIQEFNAQENPPAEYGWKPGAIVNLGIKSGTNDVHGTAYDFERNNAFDARNFFNPTTDPVTGAPSPQRGLRPH